MLNCIIAGVGGQGTILLSRLIGSAAINKGFDVRGTETIGMAQRGGSVVSHVRIGDVIHSPLISRGGAEVLIAFEPGEAARAQPFLKETGAAVVFDRPIRPVTSLLGTDEYNPQTALSFLRENIKRLIIVDGERLISECKSAKTINVALLGIAVKNGLFPFSMEDVEQALRERLPPHLIDMNIRTLTIAERM